MYCIHCTIDLKFFFFLLAFPVQCQHFFGPHLQQCLDSLWTRAGCDPTEADTPSVTENNVTVHELSLK